MPDDGPVFYLDLGSPECLLSAERILGLMPVAVEWVPVNLATTTTPGDFDAIAAVAHARGQQPMRPPVPFDAERANLAATYAKQIGRAVAFAQAALRQAYAGGRRLDDIDNIVIAASACEMHPNAVVKALETRGVRNALAAATATARERGVQRTPAVWAPDGSVFSGDTELEAAIAHLQATVAA
jgi:2-hydroxychromene-2-carboxylate isomerase